MSAPKRLIGAAIAAAAALALAACGGDDEGSSESSSEGATTATEQVIVQAGSGDFNPAQVYEKAAPGVVTVLSIFDGSGASALGGGAGQGSGFVISDEGEILTNAHVIASGGQGNGGGAPRPAKQVFVEFSDRNRVAAEIVGFDPDADVALIKVDPDDLVGAEDL
ncbi:MAG: serine protease, partial [Solirubrobacterales bacterium]